MKSSLAKVKAALLRDAETRAEHEAPAQEFVIACELIAARTRISRRSRTLFRAKPDSISR